MRAVFVLVLLTSCGRHGFEPIDGASDIGNLSDGASDADVRPPAWTRLAPLGYYPFDGTAEDLAFAGGAIACTGCTYQPGHRGSAVLAPTSSIPDHPTAGGDFTAALWIYLPALFPGGLSGCATFLSALTNLEADDEPSRIVLFSNTNNLSPVISTAVSGDAWIHVATTYLASTRSEALFVNGVLIGSGTAALPDALNPGRISGDPCAVLLDDLLLFDRVLTPSEIVEARDL